jgi:hypothetical protein
MRIGHVAAIGVLSLSSWGCGLLLGPTCLGQQHRGTGAEMIAAIGPGQVIVHTLPYESRGSQNDVEVDWNGRTEPDGPRLRFYATRVGCMTAPLPGSSGTGECSTLASAGSFGDGGYASRLIVTHGRGNPEVLGAPPAFKVWIVGDPLERTLYTMTQTWFYGPDC